jgi:hypothetical protein
VAIVRTDVSEEPGASFIRVTKICELGTTQAATLMKEAPGSSETSVLTRATRRNNPEDTILHGHRRDNLKSYNVIDVCVLCLTVEIPGTYGVLVMKAELSSVELAISLVVAC